MIKETFDKKERLKSEKIISNLFKKGGLSFPCYPLRLVYCPLEHAPEEGVLIQFGMSVPKRQFKRANVRNLIRRRLRESFRLNKKNLYAFLEQNPHLKHQQYAFMVLYVAKEVLPYADIDKGVKKMMDRFYKSLTESV